MSQQRGITSPAESLAASMAATESRTSALEVVAHQHPGRVGGVFLCTSTTRPASPTEGFTVYETDTNLYRYYDGAAWVTLINPAATSPIATAKGTTTQTSSSNTVLTDITGLSFAVVSGQMYHMKIMGTFQSAALTTGLGLSFSGPATTYCAWNVNIVQSSAGLSQNFQAMTTALTSVLVSGAVPATATSLIWEIEGYFQPSANGTLQARFRSEVNLSTVTLDAGSVAILTRVG